MNSSLTQTYTKYEQFRDTNLLCDTSVGFTWLTFTTIQFIDNQSIYIKDLPIWSPYNNWATCGGHSDFYYYEIIIS